MRPGRDDERVELATGLLNKETGVEATPDSVFQIGSMTKVWTATVVMQLVDEGKLDLDAPISRRAARAEARRTPTSPRRVTMRHLLTHTSGIDGDVFTDTGRGDDCLEKYVGGARGRRAEPPARRDLVVLQLGLLARGPRDREAHRKAPGTPRSSSA